MSNSNFRVRMQCQACRTMISIYDLAVVRLFVLPDRNNVRVLNRFVVSASFRVPISFLLSRSLSLSLSLSSFMMYTRCVLHKRCLMQSPCDRPVGYTARRMQMTRHELTQWYLLESLPTGYRRVDDRGAHGTRRNRVTYNRPVTIYPRSS